MNTTARLGFRVRQARITLALLWVRMKIAILGFRVALLNRYVDWKLGRR